MSKQSHTPGPWKFEIESKDEFRQDFILQSANEKGGEPGEHSAFIGRMTFFSNPRDEANAHLIAAAPEMLEALSLWRRYAGSTDNEGYAALSRAAKLADAAIAKARGEP